MPLHAWVGHVQSGEGLARTKAQPPWVRGNSPAGGLRTSSAPLPAGLGAARSALPTSCAMSPPVGFEFASLQNCRNQLRVVHLSLLSLFLCLCLSVYLPLSIYLSTTGSVSLENPHTVGNQLVRAEVLEPSLVHTT